MDRSEFIGLIEAATKLSQERLDDVCNLKQHDLYEFAVFILGVQAGALIKLYDEALCGTQNNRRS